MDTSNVTRVEVIDHSIPPEDGGGRVYTKLDERISVEVQIQDHGRTLKVFMTTPSI